MPNRLKTSTLVRACAMAIGAVVFAVRSGQLWVWGIASILILAALSSFATPRLYAPVERFLDLLLEWFLRAFTWVILAIVFAFLFFPAGLFLRAKARRSKAEIDSYWVTPKKGDTSRSFETLY